MLHSVKNLIQLQFLLLPGSETSRPCDFCRANQMSLRQHKTKYILKKLNAILGAFALVTIYLGQKNAMLNVS